jgi:asparagine synthase (glutamine-hydrolysing)
MVGSPDFELPWFVVLPDHESATAAAAAFRPHATQEMPHHSGRPWLLGHFAAGSVTVGQAGDTVKIAVIGQHAISASELSDVAGRIGSVADLDQLSRTLVGSSHLVASVAGTVRAQGTTTGVRRVFHAKTGGTPFAGDRADVLAWLLGGELDERSLALRLLDPPALYPFADQPVWRGVSFLPTDHYLVLDGERGRTVKWWAPPEAVLPMSDGAPALRDALGAAVDARVRGRSLVSSDLGGLDSTAVCCLAAGHEAKVVAYTLECWDPGADDARWAARTAAGLRRLEHHLIPLAEMPLSYDRILDTPDRLDEPYLAAVDRSRQFVTVRRAAARGSKMHFTGFGGDELLYGTPAHLHSLMLTNPRIAWRNLRGFATKHRWPRRQMLRQLMDRSSYGAWLARVADNLTAVTEPLETPLLDWDWQSRMPQWATPVAVDMVRELVRAEAGHVEPLAENRGQHRELKAMRFTSRIARHNEQIVARSDTAFACPYHDDRVIEAGLAVRPEERITPWRYKPLIIEAMRGVVPDESLERQTKANATYEEVVGVREHRAELLALCDESRLARLGLVDADALREVVSRPLPPHLELAGLHTTVSSEVWLRSLEDEPAGVKGKDEAKAA